MPIEVESPEEYGYARIRYNLSESSIADQSLSSLGLAIPDLTLLYNEHRGSDELRSLIAAESLGLKPDDVLITTGAAGALFIISTALLSAEDHLVVVRPNYATNLETPRAIGCETTYVDLRFDQGFKLDLDRLAAAITPRTKLINYLPAQSHRRRRQRSRAARPGRADQTPWLPPAGGRDLPRPVLCAAATPGRVHGRPCDQRLLPV